MTRATTLEKMIRTDCDQRYIEKLEDRVKHLETIIIVHRSEATQYGTRDGRGCDRKLWDGMGNTWQVDDE